MKAWPRIQNRPTQPSHRGRGPSITSQHYGLSATYSGVDVNADVGSMVTVETADTRRLDHLTDIRDPLYQSACDISLISRFLFDRVCVPKTRSVQLYYGIEQPVTGRTASRKLYRVGASTNHGEHRRPHQTRTYQTKVVKRSSAP